MKPTAADLRQLAQARKQQEERKRERVDLERASRAEREAQLYSKKIMVGWQKTVTNAASEGHLAVCVLSDGAAPDHIDSAAWLRNVADKVNRKLKASGSDIVAKVLADDWPCEGGEGHFGVFLTWS